MIRPHPFSYWTGRVTEGGALQGISDALDHLHNDATWFARARKTRLMTVSCSGDLRKAALQLLKGMVFHADNFSPWLFLEDAHLSDDAGWTNRAVRLVSQWNLSRKAFAEHGTDLGELHPPSMPENPAPRSPRGLLSPTRKLLPSHSCGRPPAELVIFARTVSEALLALRPPLEGLVVVLAPTVVQHPVSLESSLELLLGRRELTECRFVLVLDVDVEPPSRLVQALGDRALTCDCVLDAERFDNDLAAFIGSGQNSGATPRGVMPPPRIDDSPQIPREQRDKLLRDAGIEPALLDEAPKLSSLVLGAALP